MREPVFCPSDWLINSKLDVDCWKLRLIILSSHRLVLHLLMILLGLRGWSLMLEQIFSGQACSMISFKQMGLLHEVSHKLFSEHHDVVGLDLKWHPTFAYLSVDQQLAPFIFKRVFFLLKALSNLLHLCLPQPSELIKYWIDNHLNNLVFVELVWLFENILVLLATF